MVLWLYKIENLSFLLRELGKQHLLISVLGVLLAWTLCHLWRHRPSPAGLFVWATLFLWLALSPLWLTAALSLSTTLDLPRQSLLGQPCSVPFYNRFSGDLPLTRHVSWNMALLGIWALGAVAGISRWLCRRRHLWRLLRQATPIEDPQLLEQVVHWCQRLKIRRAVQLKCSAQAADAFTLGTLQPVIILPEPLLTRLNSTQLSAVIGHELAHVKRLDDLRIGLEALIRSLLWFNPLIRLGFEALRQVREIRTDRLLVDRGGLKARDYASTLLAVTGSRHTGHYPAPTFGTRRGELPQRLHALLHPARTPGFSAVLITTTLLATMTLVLSFGAPSPVALSEQAGRALQQLAPISPLATGRITQDYYKDGDRCHIGIPRSWHHGLDFATSSTDRSVRAIQQGTVKQVYRSFGGYSGYTIRVQHADGFASLYVHLERVQVQPGTLIQQGTELGRLDSNQYLHFEIHHHGQIVDLSSLTAQLTPNKAQ